MQSDDLGLVERLRRGPVAYTSAGGPIYDGPDPLMDEAAAAIERLVAEARQAALGEDVANALLQRSRDHVDRLKEALNDILHWDEEYRASMSPEVEKDPVTLACDRARQALKDAP